MLDADNRLVDIDDPGRRNYYFRHAVNNGMVRFAIAFGTSGIADIFLWPLTFSGKSKYNQMKTEGRFVSSLMGKEGP